MNAMVQRRLLVLVNKQSRSVEKAAERTCFAIKLDVRKWLARRCAQLRVHGLEGDEHVAWEEEGEGGRKRGGEGGAVEMYKPAAKVGLAKPPKHTLHSKYGKVSVRTAHYNSKAC